MMNMLLAHPGSLVAFRRIVPLCARMDPATMTLRLATARIDAGAPTTIVARVRRHANVADVLLVMAMGALGWISSEWLRDASWSTLPLTTVAGNVSGAPR